MSFSCDSESNVPLRLSTDEENELLILHPIYLRAQARADELLAKLDGNLDRFGILELDTARKMDRNEDERMIAMQENENQLNKFT